MSVELPVIKFCRLVGRVDRYCGYEVQIVGETRPLYLEKDKISNPKPQAIEPQTGL
jgi:hypothetical protein